MTQTQKKVFCSQCAHSDTKRAADFKVIGTMNRRPYRANLCLEHHDMMLLDGANFSIGSLQPEASAEAVALFAEMLWKNYEEMKRMSGVDSQMTERAHRQYIVIANRARDMGLNF